MSKYDEILHYDYQGSKTRKKMSLYNRAAQFSPFAALVGHDAAIKESARLTDSKIELSEDEKVILNEKLNILSEHLPYDITVTYFIHDLLKDGGCYQTRSDVLLKINQFDHILEFKDKKISFYDILELECDLF